MKEKISAKVERLNNAQDIIIQEGTITFLDVLLKEFCQNNDYCEEFFFEYIKSLTSSDVKHIISKYVINNIGLSLVGDSYLKKILENLQTIVSMIK